MDNLEDQLNQLLAQSDRVSAELKREIYLVERADAAIRYLREAREKTAHEVAGLLAQRPRAQRDPSALADVSTRSTPPEAPATTQGNHKPFGPYDPHWPNKQKSTR